MRFAHLIAGSIAIVISQLAASQTAPTLNEKLLREAMVNHLKDAESARFKSIVYKPSGPEGMWEMCGEVNAKNAFGGYVGFTKFIGAVVKHGKKPPTYIVVAVGETADTMCQK